MKRKGDTNKKTIRRAALFDAAYQVMCDDNPDDVWQVDKLIAELLEINNIGELAAKALVWQLLTHPVLNKIV